MTLVAAADGIAAREVGPWSRDKLYYVGRYLDAFCVAMKGKWAELVYADLLCGPGRCVVEHSHVEFRGSPMLAVDRAEFSRLFLNDADPAATRALALRIPRNPRVRLSTQDCNDVVGAARSFLFPRAHTRTLGLAVLDPTAFQITFDAISRLTTGVRLDLIVIFMTQIAKRFFDHPALESRLDRFFGSHDWRDLKGDWLAGEELTTRKLLDFYEDRLRTLDYVAFDDHIRMVNSRESTIYHLVFASKHEAGADLFRKISARRADGQYELRLMEEKESYSV